MLAYSTIDANNMERARKFYDALFAELGVVCEGAAGPRLNGLASGGYVRDLDGDKLNVFRMGS
ncbi:MAG: hypothetical protein ACX939_01905 [Hyphococcus sp.]